MPVEVLRTSQLARAAGVNIQTLRYYERQGLLAAPRRTASGYRQYPPDALRVVSFVKRAQHLGFTLKEIQSLLRLRSAGANRPRVRAAAETKLRDIEQRIRDLTAMKEALRSLLAACGCDASIYCPILEALEGGKSDAGA